MATMANNDLATSQPTCQNCTTSTTPLWRRDEVGSVLCNACGLFLKLHGRPRPISLKTDVIKSRNRVKSSGSGQVVKKKVNNRNPSVSSLILIGYSESFRVQWFGPPVAKRNPSSWIALPSSNLTKICERPFRRLELSNLTNCHSFHVR
jgi:hypothetical protein